MTITEVQTNVINTLTKAGYQNVKDNLLVGITENEHYPFVVVDLASSIVQTIASGKYTPGVHYLIITCYQKAKIGITQARQSAVSTLEAVMELLNLQILENKIEYVDTVMNNIKVCGAGCIVEVGAY